MYHRSEFNRFDMQQVKYEQQLKNSEANSGLYTNLAAMYT